MPFLPTPSARRATGGHGVGVGARGISTHALREEGDRRVRTSALVSRLFLPTPSARRATFSRPDKGPLREYISTHALREEGDGNLQVELTGMSDFYPRPPRGGRHVATSKVHIVTLFLPTPSARRATRSSHWGPRSSMISTHALREEGDPSTTPPPS